MRQAADILSSAPAMQIRYLEAMQTMANTANSKVIFLPAANQTMPMNSQILNSALDNSKPYEEGEGTGNNPFSEFASGDHSFQSAMNARVVENI